MRLQPGDGGVEILFAPEEAGVLKQLVHQLVLLLESHSNTPLDPDPLFASLEVGGTDETPDDPALARLLPDAFADAEDAAGFRRVTEQGLINRKLQDAHQVIMALSVTPDGVADGPEDVPGAGAATGGDVAADGAHDRSADSRQGRVAGGTDAGVETEPDTDVDEEYFGDGVPVAVNITQDSFPAWARTVTAVRLAMAARIGLESEADHERLIDLDATRGTVLVYDWLAALLEAVIALGDASSSGVDSTDVDSSDPSSTDSSSTDDG